MSPNDTFEIGMKIMIVELLKNKVWYVQSRSKDYNTEFIEEVK